MALSVDGMLWQLLKAYANEDWDHMAEPWPAPASAFLSDCSTAEAAQLARELETIARLELADTGWRALLEDADVDVSTLGDDLATWADDLLKRAKAASSS